MKALHVIAALLLAAVPAQAATMSNNCRVDLRFMESAGNLFAVVQVDATWGLLIDGDLRLSANGQQIKVEPILTSTQQNSITYLGPAGTTVMACVTVEGRNWISADVWLDAQSTDCGFRSSETGNGAPSPGRAPRAPRTPAPVSSLVRPR